MSRSRRVLGLVLVLGLSTVGTISAPAAEPVAQRVDQIPGRSANKPTLEQDIAALADFHGRGVAAAGRLAERGDEVLPELHAAMLKPAADVKQQLQLATIVGEIGDTSSVEPLIQLAQANPSQSGVRQTVLSMLAELQPTAASIAFASEIADDTAESWRVRRKALVFFGRHRIPQSRRYIDLYRNDAEIELRAGALYISARLGDAAARTPMVEMLAAPAPPSLRYVLMLGIAELAGPAEVTQLTPEWIHPSWEYESALRYAEFRSADEAARLAMTPQMVASDAIYDRQVALEHLLRVRGPEALADFAAASANPRVRGVARHQLRQAGFRVRLDDTGRVQTQPRDQP